ncbi:hypothetical protein CDD82_4702 [Ophiocordyceps australis]|uniref:Uncharacterized protein n=1 Tax=Ophiocordyceps australis TaxID=1399860 RepID=A0A2C5ZSM7_9HYPO|nr:hypothetical protein CDD82_4702 [Ophiocordyceps australis]
MLNHHPDPFAQAVASDAVPRSRLLGRDSRLGDAVGQCQSQLASPWPCRPLSASSFLCPESPEYRKSTSNTCTASSIVSTEPTVHLTKGPRLGLGRAALAARQAKKFDPRADHSQQRQHRSRVPRLPPVTSKPAQPACLAPFPSDVHSIFPSLSFFPITFNSPSTPSSSPTSSSPPYQRPF